MSCRNFFITIFVIFYSFMWLQISQELYILYNRLKSNENNTLEYN